MASSSRTNKPRNRGQWTEARFFGFIRSALRKASQRWPPIAQHALENARRAYSGPNKRMKWEYQCAACEKWLPRKSVQVDHIVPCGTLRRFEDLGDFASRLFCEESGLTVLCISCHKKKTSEERDARKKNTG